MWLLYSEMHTFEEYGLKGSEIASISVYRCHGHRSPCVTLTSAEFTVITLCRWSGLFLFKNVLWMQLHSVYSSVTGFFHPACFWDLSVLLVSVVSYFWVVLRCMDTLFFNSFTCWTHGLFRVLALSKAVMSIVDISFNFSWVGKSLVGGLLGHRVNNDWTL